MTVTPFSTCKNVYDVYDVNFIVCLNYFPIKYPNVKDILTFRS